MRIVFCGTPQFAVPSLKLLHSQPDFELTAVISQPDRPRGRGQEVAVLPVKEAALAAGLKIHQPESIRSPEAAELLRQLAPDCVVIIAYGQIIPARLLTIPRFGWINLHASLLPKYRGAAPINWAIVNGETTTGVTSMRIDSGMDTGDILLQRDIHIGESETAPELALRMAQLGAPLIVETLRGLSAGNITPRPQHRSEATLAPLLKREDGLINWKLPAKEIYNHMRGLTPWPGTYSMFRGRVCHLWGEPASRQTETPPGSFLFDGADLQVACGNRQTLCVISVKLEGRKQISAKEFVNGAHLTTADRFESA
jgi:methionyl-tRNA formyltransferase